MAPTLPSRCLLFADVAGSTRLYERLGDQNALRAVELCLQTAARALAQYRGRVVKTIGDEIMAVFPSAGEGLLAACEIQQQLHALPSIGGEALAIRVGCHWGPVIEEAGDFFGDTVNTAARLGALAKAGQVLTSADTLAAVAELLRLRSRVLEPLALKGKQEPLAIVELLWQGSEENMTLLAESPRGRPAQALVLSLRHGERRWLLNGEKPSLSLGRDAGSELVIADGRASRSHARIELRQQHFVLVDCSTNGTYVVTSVGNGAGGDGHGILLRREETVLHGSGRLSFGQPWQAGVECVEFQVLE